MMNVGILNILTLIFIVLKLTDTIDWSWWWILSPTIAAVLVAIGVIITLILVTPNRMRL